MIDQPENGVFYTPDELEAIKSERRPYDDSPVPLTHYQLMKIGAIVDAAARGQARYLEELTWVSHFLTLRAAEVTLSQAHMGEQRATVWAHLDRLPWPAA